MGFLHQAEPSFALLSLHSWSLSWSLEGEWQPSNQAANSSHCTLRCSEEPASSSSCIRTSRYTTPAEKDFCYRLNVCIAFHHFFKKKKKTTLFSLNQYHILDTLNTTGGKKILSALKNIPVKENQLKAFSFTPNTQKTKIPSNAIIFIT